jgi:hypothetical protein
MKEPDLGTPVADDIRAHFGKLLSPDTEIEIIPHTRVWATTAGVLLWDPKNGYARLDVYREPDNLVRFTPIDATGQRFERKPYPGSDRKPAYMSTTNEVKIMPALKLVIYLTGPQASGKSTLISLMADAVELNRHQFIGFTDLSRNITKHNHHQTVVITSNSTAPEAFNVNNALHIWCRERKIKYLHINLAPVKNGN